MPRIEPNEVLGAMSPMRLSDFHKALTIEQKTPYQWIKRGVLPPPRGVFLGNYYWLLRDVIGWADTHKRRDLVRAEYRDMLSVPRARAEVIEEEVYYG